jgi:hypothetical protein
VGGVPARDIERFPALVHGRLRRRTLSMTSP